MSEAMQSYAPVPGFPIARSAFGAVLLALAFAFAVPAPAAAFEAGDVGEGRKVFKVCKNCHSVKEGKTGTFGPNLYQVVGRVAGAVPGYPYSETFATADFAWTPERIDEFITNPSGRYPDTKMKFKGLPDAGDRANVIAYLIAAGER
jgi:cytochrome c2